MGDRARRSRGDGGTAASPCSRHAIDTLFPGLSNKNCDPPIPSLKASNSSTNINPSPLPMDEVDEDGLVESIPIQSYCRGRLTKAEVVEQKNEQPVQNCSLEEDTGIEDQDRKSVSSSSNGEEVCSSSGSGISSQSHPRNSSRSNSSKLSEWGSTLGATKRKAGSPLKPTTQPKHHQMYPPPLGLTKLSKKEMFQAFQPWVEKTYGDTAKTKTITKKKYNRIVKTLRGEEINNAENSKFRFWVKAKGFHIGPPSGQLCVKDEKGILAHPVPNEPDLYVPTTVKDGSGLEKPIFKRVAVVEYFFDIIYMVHVETEAKNGKHAGQKRTYRAITEKYAFLPREAVTKFLLQCTECQKRGPAAESSISSGRSGGSLTKIFAVDRSPTRSPLSLGPIIGGLQSPIDDSLTPQSLSPPPPQSYSGKNLSDFDINFGLPLFPSTTTPSYLDLQEEKLEQGRKQIRGKHGFKQDEDVDELIKIEGNRMVKMSHSSNRKKIVPSKVKVKVRAPISRESHLMDSTSGDDEQDLRVKTKGSSGSGRSKNGEGKDVKGADMSKAMDWLGYQPLGLNKKEATNNNIYSNGKHEFREQSSPLSHSDRLAVNHETVHDETSSNGNKDDDDDDDDESEDKMDTQQHDPERLKAFNMFVRLFVDENLDRMVPISKQPKEKIQAIIDSCTRQFPEFAERARKRIRTYLKSCRRNKRSRDGGWESSRPTPAHLTSVQAEQVLAQACENESQNAKRMRMGMEPIAQPLPLLPLSESRSSKENGHHSSDSSSPEKISKVSHVSSNSSIAATINMVASNGCFQTSNTTSTGNSLSPSSSSISAAAATPATVTNDQKINLSLNGVPTSASNGESLLNQLPSSILGTTNKGLERSPLVDYSRTLNGNGAASMSMYRPNFNQTFQRPAPFPSLFPAVAAAASVVGALGNTTFPPNVSPLPLANGDAGPTDLSMKSKPLLAQKLSTTDVTTVRQLITGYRESAAFLLRSADELEQLLIQQQ